MTKYLMALKFNCNSSYLDDTTMNSLSKDLTKLCKKYNIEFKSHESMALRKEKYSICTCDSCNNWMINRDKNPCGLNDASSKNDFEFLLYDGGVYNNQILCEDCLPALHRWSGKQED